MSRATTVLLAEEQAAVRSAVRQLLEEAGFEVCGEVGNAGEALAQARSLRPDVCITGLRMSGDALQTITTICDELPETAVIVLTESQLREDLVGAIRAGAKGYLLKDMRPERIPHAVRGVLEGEAAVPRSLVAGLLRELQLQSEGRVVRTDSGSVELTPREWEVLDLLAERLSTAEIAQRLYISTVTVRRHISGILTKLDVPDRATAVELLDG